MKRKSSGNKKVRNATASEYNGIKFRSKLELFSYKKFEEAGIPVLYEEVRYVLQDGFYFEPKCIEPNKKGEYIDVRTKVRAITYTPDFVDPQGRFIVEVKGFANDVFPMKWKMFKNYLRQHSPDTILFLPKNQKQVLETIEQIKNL